DNDALAIDGIDHTGALTDNDSPRISSSHALHTGAHIGRLGAQQRNRLTLHVRTHQGAVRVVVFKKRNETGSDRDELFGTDVHVLDFVTMFQDEVAGLTSVDQVFDDAAVVIDGNVCLSDDVLVFFPSGEIVGVRFKLGLLLLGSKSMIRLLHAFASDDLTDFVIRVTRIENFDFVNQNAFPHSPIGAF